MHITPINKMMPLSSYFIIALLFSFTSSADIQENFVQCLYNYPQNATSISKVVNTQANSSYSSILQFSIQNPRFSNASSKPLVIVTPLAVSHIQATIICSQRHGLQIRTRSGGHDYEGLSYVAKVPFVLIDLINLREINVDVENSTAWVQAGATVGELYYSISQKSTTLGFPGGVWPSMGTGGHFSGGGYGFLMRRYGLAADNIIDAHIIDVKGNVLDREGMGEDLFWAIRGGGGASFGVIVAWKLKLVPVPSTVTVFKVPRTLEQNATEIIHKWQLVVNKLDDGLMIRINIERVNSSQSGKPTVQAIFESMYLGGVDELIPLMQKSFPELGLVRQDCTEMSWIDSVLYIARSTSGQPREALLNRTGIGLPFFKAKSDYVRDPIPVVGLQGLWSLFYEDEALAAFIQFTPYGGKMDEISESEIPFPHRSGNIFHIHHLVRWQEEGDEAAQRHVEWIRRVYTYMEAYVSKSPRAAYVNYRDLDIGVNNDGYTSYSQASIWGLKYFKNNFNRLARVKAKVDPLNFFRNEQSIPPLKSKGRKTQIEILGAANAIIK
ncbi:berberine bridge enzyme-like 15 [Cajanus cajan]|uniref:berberine bridge enzyme-like 15 n=1 Tax=Cajanus cajan TaxID=3821 RepID=UPI00098DBB43|nr:berberine bridge enzyme-like 15 [Cajanus cajan]